MELEKLVTIGRFVEKKLRANHVVLAIGYALLLAYSVETRRWFPVGTEAISHSSPWLLAPGPYCCVHGRAESQKWRVKNSQVSLVMFLSCIRVVPIRFKNVKLNTRTFLFRFLHQV